ncbi:MAG: phosphoglucomutase/phosphomannomutase family protein [Bacteroidetes bacterium]|nr:phosphoglucomutase/phosphomannomutase family protein [Bacteroidota bacterium]
MDDPLRFGTDGWRAVIGQDFTFNNLSRLARATAQWLKKSGIVQPKIVVGHDTRFMGRQFSEHVSHELAMEGVDVILAAGPTPTPAISWAASQDGVHAGVMITASHNPPEYSGYKIKSHLGAPATPTMINEVESFIQPFHHRTEKSHKIQEANIRTDYVNHLRNLVDLPALDLTLIHDSMYGAGQGIMNELLGNEVVIEIHGELNPGFAGVPPEPIERNLSELMRQVVQQKASIGIAHDGDADRIGVVDEHGQIVTSHMLMALLAAHLHKYQNKRGAIVRTFATSAILEKIGLAWGLPVETYPIGFKYVAPRFVETGVLVGGEESGGIAVAGHIPERDGIYVALMVLKMLIERQQPISVLVQELFDEFGPHAYYRSDIHTEKQKEIIKDLHNRGGLHTIDQRQVQSMDTLDGFKHIMQDAWLLIRPSGTEPVLRIYAEAPTRSEAEALVHDTKIQFGLPV